MEVPDIFPTDFLNPKILKGLTPLQYGAVLCLAENHAEIGHQTYLPFSDPLEGEEREMIWLYAATLHPRFARNFLTREKDAALAQRVDYTTGWTQTRRDLATTWKMKLDGKGRRLFAAMRERRLDDIDQKLDVLERAADDLAYDLIPHAIVETQHLLRGNKIVLLSADDHPAIGEVQYGWLYAIGERYRLESSQYISRVLDRIPR
jgi:hypothetical protein